jgi:hypothetical protein
MTWAARGKKNERTQVMEEEEREEGGRETGGSRVHRCDRENVMEALQEAGT